MVSYIKTQWFRLLVAIVSFVIALVYALKPAPDTSTLEGLDTLMTYSINACVYFVNFLLWIFTSFIGHNSNRIELLEKKAEKYDAMYDLVQELLEANKEDRQYADHLNRKIESFIIDTEKKEKQK